MYDDYFSSVDWYFNKASRSAEKYQQNYFVQNESARVAT